MKEPELRDPSVWLCYQEKIKQGVTRGVLWVLKPFWLGYRALQKLLLTVNVLTDCVLVGMAINIVECAYTLYFIQHPPSPIFGYTTGIRCM